MQGGQDRRSRARMPWFGRWRSWPRSLISRGVSTSLLREKEMSSILTLLNSIQWAPEFEEGMLSTAAGAMRWVGGSGGAVLRKDVFSESTQIVVALGAWVGYEGCTLLESFPTDWLFTFEREAKGLVRGKKGWSTIDIDSHSFAEATAVLFPLCWLGEPLGVLLVTSESPGALSFEGLTGARLLACQLSGFLAYRQLRDRNRDQADRISRLMNDVERMSILLRKAGEPSDGSKC